jgi:hypothetical protein
MTTSISDLFPEPSMWWHADFPAPLSAPGPTGTPPEPEARGEFLLEWILPTLEGERAAGAHADGGERRSLRNDLREGESG